ncbi:MAG: hypothetical protein WCY91_09315, partial [Acidithiobacillus sp.]
EEPDVSRHPGGGAGPKNCLNFRWGGGGGGLGVWQGVFLFEHRLRPVSRQVLVSFQGVVQEV